MPSTSNLDPVPWAITLSGTSRCLCFTPADPDRHTAVLHDWLHRPHVAAWWGPDRRPAEVHEYLVRQRALAHLTPWFVSLWDVVGGSTDDTLIGYVETYRAAYDRLAQFAPQIQKSDRGWHVLVGLHELLGSGIPRLIGRAVLARLLSDPEGVERVVCEPNERNGRMLGYCAALGYQHLGVIEMPEKKAALLACTRAMFEARWPGDLEAGEASWLSGDGT